MKVKYSVRFFVKQPQGKSKSENRVIVRLTFDEGQKYETSTNLKCHPSHWDKRLQRFKNGAPNCAANNLILKSIREELETIYKEGKAAGHYVNSTYIKERYRKTAKDSWLDVYDKYLNDKRKSWTSSTYRKHQTLRKHFEDMQKQGIALNFAAVNYDWWLQVRDYFQGIDHINSTIKKSFTFIRTFLLYAIKLNKCEITNENLTALKIIDKAQKHQTENIIFLKPDEFLKLFDAPLHFKPTWDKARDLFCFMCATGLRVGELEKLRTHHIQNGEIVLTTAKTIDPVKAPLNQFAQEILDKHKDNPLVEPGEVLPRMHPNNINIYIKQIGEVLELNRYVTEIADKEGKVLKNDYPLWKKLRCHIGRKTFFSLSIALEMNERVTMRLGGMKSAKLIDVYGGIKEDVKRREVAKFNRDQMKKIS
jgi:integrase